MCFSECPPGTYHDEEISGHCLDCSTTCNTCTNDPYQCTSCLFEKGTVTDLFYIEKSNECVSTCPLFMAKDLKMHRCEPSPTLLLSLERWTTILLIGSMIALITAIILSAIVSNNFCDKIKLASAILCLIESLNRLCLFLTLWNSDAFVLFCTVGVCTLASSLLAVIFIETTYIPVQNALKQE